MDENPVKPKYPNRFPPGVSGNPAGRPAGTGGKRLMEAFDQALTAEAAVAIALKCVDQAKRGDRFAREDLAKLHGLFQDRLHLSGAAQILWNWQPPGEEPAQPAESGLPGAEAETDSEQG